MCHEPQKSWLVEWLHSTLPNFPKLRPMFDDLLRNALFSYTIWLKTIFYKVDVEISNNLKICRILALLFPAALLKKVGKNFASFWIIWNFHINLIKNVLYKPMHNRDAQRHSENAEKWMCCNFSMQRFLTSE